MVTSPHPVKSSFLWDDLAEKLCKTGCQKEWDGV